MMLGSVFLLIIFCPNTMADIINLFPTPVMKFNYNNKITDVEQKTFSEYLADSVTNEGNLSSVNTDVLADPRLLEIKNFIINGIQTYFNTIICPANNVEPYITLSWLNLTQRGGYHHKHAHANSIISGVFYINANKNYDKIIFYKNDYINNIEFVSTNFNSYNSSLWWIETATRDLLLFPSNLPHSVPIHEQHYDRISLSFNVFVRGELGSKDTLNYLKLGPL